MICYLPLLSVKLSVLPIPLKSIRATLKSAHDTDSLIEASAYIWPPFCVATATRELIQHWEPVLNPAKKSRFRRWTGSFAGAG